MESPLGLPLPLFDTRTPGPLLKAMMLPSPGFAPPTKLLEALINTPAP